MEDLRNLQNKVDHYKEILQNTTAYRQKWKNSLRDFIRNQLEEMVSQTGLNAKVFIKEGMENLEAVVLSLGDIKSGIYETINDEINRHLIKHNGSLIYQQLFNGKIIVLVQYPMIENYGQPKPPKTIAIYRPDELKDPYLVRHMETLMTEVANWEDYDDDEPGQKIGFHLNFEKNE